MIDVKHRKHWTNFMKKNLKASLLSAFVYPGIGQIYNKSMVLGWSLIVIASACIYKIFNNLWIITQETLQQIELGKISSEPVAIYSHLEKNLYQSGSDNLSVLIMVLSSVWIISFVEPFLTSRSSDNSIQEEKH